MFTTAVDKLLSQFFALSAERKILHSGSSPLIANSINNSDGVESFLSKRLDVSRSGRPACPHCSLIKSCKNGRHCGTQRLYVEIAAKALVGAAGPFSTIARKKFLNGSNTSSASWTGFLSESAHEGAEFPWIPLFKWRHRLLDGLQKDTQLGKTDRRRRS